MQEQYPEIAAKIDDFIKRLSTLLKVETSFNIVRQSNVIIMNYDRHIDALESLNQFILCM